MARKLPAAFLKNIKKAKAKAKAKGKKSSKKLPAFLRRKK